MRWLEVLMNLWQTNAIPERTLSYIYTLTSERSMRCYIYASGRICLWCIGTFRPDWHADLIRCTQCIPWVKSPSLILVIQFTLSRIQDVIYRIKISWTHLIGWAHRGDVQRWQREAIWFFDSVMVRHLAPICWNSLTGLMYDVEFYIIRHFDIC